MSGNQSAAGKSQKQQRHQFANQKDQDRGSGGSKGRGATPASTSRNAPRAGSGGGEGKATSQQASSKTSQNFSKRQAAHARVKLRLEQGSVHFLRPRLQQKPACGKIQGGSSGSSSGIRGKRRPPSPKHRADDESHADNASRGGYHGRGGRRALTGQMLVRLSWHKYFNSSTMTVFILF